MKQTQQRELAVQSASKPVQADLSHASDTAALLSHSSSCQQEPGAHLLTQTASTELKSVAFGANTNRVDLSMQANQTDRLTASTVPDQATAALPVAMQTSSNKTCFAALDSMMEPCSQLLEDSPMELWEFESSVPPHTEDRSENTNVNPDDPVQVSDRESQEALRQLEDFCKCRAVPETLITANMLTVSTPEHAAMHGYWVFQWLLHTSMYTPPVTTSRLAFCWIST